MTPNQSETTPRGSYIYSKLLDKPLWLQPYITLEITAEPRSYAYLNLGHFWTEWHLASLFNAISHWTCYDSDESNGRDFKILLALSLDLLLIAPSTLGSRLSSLNCWIAENQELFLDHLTHLNYAMCYSWSNTVL